MVADATASHGYMNLETILNGLLNLNLVVTMVVTLMNMLGF